MVRGPAVSVGADTLADVQTDAFRERSGGGRRSLVLTLLADALESVREPGRAPLVLDCGGGSGAVAVPLAASGAAVTVVDISADALATLRRRADEAGVSAAVHPLQADVESLDDVVPAGGFDLVLAHGILGAVEHVTDTFTGCARAVRVGGLLSVLVVNPAALVLARALAGEPAAALDELRTLDAASAQSGPQAVERLCADAGLTIEARHGIGVFTDLVPGAALDASGARDALAALDVEAAGRSPFAEIAGRVHLLARRHA